MATTVLAHPFEDLTFCNLRKPTDQAMAQALLCPQHALSPKQAADRQAQATIGDFAPAQLPLLLCAFAALGQEPGAAVVNAVGEALAHQDLQVDFLKV